MRVRIVMTRPDGATVTRLRWVAGSLATHLVAVAALVLWPAPPRALAPSGGAISVALVGRAPAASAGGGASTTAVPAVEPEPPEAEPHGAALESREIRAAKIPEPRPEPRPEPSAKTSASPPNAAHSTRSGDVRDASGAPEGAAEGSPAGSALDGVVGGDSALGGVGSEHGWYVARVTAALRDHWQRPPLDPQDNGLVAVVTFRIRRDGRVLDPQIEVSSGESLLDRSALRAVLDSDPLPPLPRGLDTDVVPARFEFRWHADGP
jgi:protein TonB